MKKIIYCFVVLLLSCTSSYALKISGYNTVGDNRFDRFSSGFASNPQKNNTFFAKQYDWSGVGWQTSASTKGVTLITDQYFLCANHYRPSGSISFFGADNQVHSYNISGFYNLPQAGGIIPDLCLGRLEEVVDSSIKRYSVIKTDDSTWYNGRDVLVYGKGGTSPRVGKNSLDGFASVRSSGTVNNATSCLKFNYDPTNGFGESEAGFETGDSSSPTLLTYNNNLTVAGVHFAVDGSTTPYNNYDSFVSDYIEDIDNVMQNNYNSSLDSNRNSVTVITVPEPSSFLLLGLPMLMGILKRRKK